MMAGPPLTQALLRTLIHYDPISGRVTRLRRTANRHQVGEYVGALNSRGYLQATFFSIKRPVHRLIWFWLYGHWPSGDIDHINRNRQDNRLCNLREVTRSENNHNAGANSRNTSGYRGVCWDKSKQLWVVHISVAGKTYFLGRYADPQVAACAYKAAKRTHHPTAPQAQD
jgi:hypothetical protein